MTIKQYLTRHWGYDSGHALIGIGIGLVLFSLGVPVSTAASLGGLLFAIPKEAYDIKHKGFGLDNVCDLVSYQTAWPAVYLADGQPMAAAAFLMLVGVVYLALVSLKVEG